MSGERVGKVLERVAQQAWDEIRTHDNEVADIQRVLEERLGPLVAAAQLTVLHFRRNNASGNFQGDDEHECWTALASALAALERESTT